MEKERPPAEVLVVGAGPVGLTVACELARRGVKLRIVDKAPAVAETSRALAVFPRTLEVFSFMGIADRVLEAGRKLEGIAFFGERGPAGRLDFTALRTPYPFVLTLPQAETERLLGEHLASFGVEVERGIELIGFAQDGEGVRSILRRPGVRREETLRSAWLLGCDGAHSTVRHILGAGFEGWGPGRPQRETFILADVKLEGALPSNHVHLFLSREGIFGVVPFGRENVRLIANLPEEPFAGRAENEPEPTLADFDAMAARRGAHGVRFRDPFWISRFGISYRKVRHFRHGRVFLSGDAAHIHSPAGGQGMNTGIQDAFNLAWKLALVTHGASGEELLESYGKEREPVARGVLRLTDGITNAATARGTLARRVRDLLLPPLLRWETATRRAARRLAELDIRYPEGAVVEDRSGEPLRAGDRAPDAALVELATGRPVRLFELFRDTRPVLLAFEGLQSRPESRAQIGALLGAFTDSGQSLEDYLIIRPIVRDYAFPDAASLLDRSGAVHLLYDADAGGAVLVRPDGYIGYRSGWRQIGHLRDYLARLFSRLPLATR